MSKNKIYLTLSLVLTIISAGAIEFYILFAEGFGQGIIQSPTVLGEIIIIIIKAIPIIAVLYNLFLLIFEKSLPENL